MTIQLIRSGSKLILSGGRPIRTTMAAAGALTALSLVDFFSGYPYTASNPGGGDPIIQRKAGLLTGDVPVLFNCTGTPSNVQARVVKWADASVVKDWASLTSVNATATAGIGYLVGVPQGAKYLLQIRDGNDPTNVAKQSNGTQRWGVGTIWLLMGQSNMESTLGGDYNAAIPGTSTNEFAYNGTGAVPGAIFGPYGWSNQGYNNGGFPYAGYGISAFMRHVAAGLNTKYGHDVPVGMILVTRAGTPADAFTLTGGYWKSSFADLAGTTINTIGEGSPKNYWSGDFEGCMWHQGEAGPGTSFTTYEAALTSIYTGLLSTVAPYGRTKDNFYFAPAVIGNYGISSQLSQIEIIRSAILNFASTVAPANGWPNVRVGWCTMDCIRPTDAYHFNNLVGAQKSMRRLVQTVLYFLGCATFGGRGPKITSVTRSGLVLTVNVTQDGGTSLVVPTPANPITGFNANIAADFSGPLIAPTAAALVNGNTQIQLTLPAGTTFPVYLKYQGGRTTADSSTTGMSDPAVIANYLPDFSNCVYDNVSYPTSAAPAEHADFGLPLLPTQTAIMVN